MLYQVGGVIMWGFWDSAHWRPQAAIAEGDNVTPNEAGEAYIRLMHKVNCDCDNGDCADIIGGGNVEKENAPLRSWNMYLELDMIRL